MLAASGLDALSQLIEPFLSIRANPVTDALAREAIPRSAAALPRAYAAARAGERDRAGDREALALASLFGGLCLANAGLGAVHGFAAPVGGMFAAPHGAVCAALLPAVLRVNARALAARAPDSAALARLRELAAMLTGRPDATTDDGIAWVATLLPRAGDPGPRPLRHDRRSDPGAGREGARRQQHEGQPAAAHRRRADRDRARVAVKRARCPCSSRARG